MTGRCVCKPGVRGAKCDECSLGRVLTIHGCTDGEQQHTQLTRVQPLNTSANCFPVLSSMPLCAFRSTESISRPVARSCAHLACQHGAKCREKGRRAQCVCDQTCPEQQPDDTSSVCGSDGLTYSSACELRLASCRLQESIVLLSNSSCSGQSATHFRFITSAPFPLPFAPPALTHSHTLPVLHRRLVTARLHAVETYDGKRLRLNGSQAGTDAEAERQATARMAGQDRERCDRESRPATLAFRFKESTRVLLALLVLWQILRTEK